ncbi:hypothetical protein D922_03510 [Enterococcus faecalis 06-MB-DW-09]|nr:hypothetical protein D931_03661 [Enterococcus faecium 13.SD.W.09]EPH89587.1 hypothetical protein D922_03510 [Enterococcus faecalis 06-MB-DW-09]
MLTSKNTNSILYNNHEIDKKTSFTCFLDKKKDDEEKSSFGIC